MALWVHNGGVGMRVDYLREYVDLTQTRSFTRTAERFFITQSALSKHIAAVERELGFELLVCDRQGVSCTPFGEIFLQGAQAALESIDTAIARMDELGAAARASCTVGYLVGASRPFLPAAVALLDRNCPDVDFRFLPMRIGEMVDALASGAVDAAIATETFDIPDGWRTYTIYSDRYCAIMSPRHRLARREAVSVADLADESVWLIGDTFLPSEAKLAGDFLKQVVGVEGAELQVADFDQFPLVVADDRSVIVTLGHVRYTLGDLLAYRPFVEPAPSERVLLAWAPSAGEAAERLRGAIAESMELFGGYRQV